MRRRERSETARPFRWGIAFKDGKIYLFRRSGVLVMRPWGRRAGAWHLEAGRGWRGVRPTMTLSPRRARVPSIEKRIYSEEWPPGSGDAQCILPFRGDRHAERRWKAWKAFFERIPEEAIALACDRGFPSRHWWVLQMLNRVGEPAFELAESHPALAFAVACAPAIGLRHRRQHELSRRLVRMKRRDIVTALGFSPPTGSRFTSTFAVTLLSALPPRLTTVSRLLAMRDALSSDDEHAELARKRLAHLASKPLTDAGLAICTDPTLITRFTPRCLEELSDLRPITRARVLVARAKSFAARCRREHGAPTDSPRFRSIDQLETTLREDAEYRDISDRVLSRHGTTAFPPTPFSTRTTQHEMAAGLHVEVLDSVRKVIDASRRDGLCLVSGYLDDLVAGQASVCRLTLGEETAYAGLSRVQNDGDARYFIFEISGRYNEEPSLAMRSATRAFLESSGHAADVTPDVEAGVVEAMELPSSLRHLIEEG